MTERVLQVDVVRSEEDLLFRVFREAHRNVVKKFVNICVEGNKVFGIVEGDQCSICRGRWATVSDGASPSCHEMISIAGAMERPAVFMPMPKRPMPLRLLNTIDPAEGGRDLEDVGADAGTIVVHDDVGLERAFFAGPGLTDEDADFAGADADGVVYMLAERRGGAVIADIAERLDEGLGEEQRNSG